MLNNVDLNKLKALYCVSREQSLRKAAERLKVTPSAVFQSVRALETSLGTRLFARSGKRYVPLPAAQQLMGVVAPFFQELEREVRELRGGGAGISGTLRMGCVAELGRRWLVSRVASFRRMHPAARFEVSLQDTAKLVNDVLVGALDFALCDSGPYQKRQPRLAFRPVFREELVLVCSARYYRDHVEGDHSFAHLSRLSHVPYHLGQEAVHKWYAHHFGRVPKLDPELAIDSASAVLEAIREGIGLGVVPAEMAAPGVRRRQLQVITTAKKPLVNEVAIAQLRDRIETRLEKAFLAHLAGGGVRG